MIDSRLGKGVLEGTLQERILTSRYLMEHGCSEARQAGDRDIPHREVTRATERDAKRRRRQEERWAGKSGDVIVRIEDLSSEERASLGL